MTADEKLTFSGRVADNGEIMLPRRFRTDVARLFPGRDIVVIVERRRRKRTQNQNAYYWAVIVQMICDGLNAAGENVNPQEVHEFLKFRFLRIQKTDPDTGELLWEYSRSTSALKAFEFSLYLDQCIQFAAEYLGIQIPPPHTQTEMYSFPEYQGLKESRPDYLERVALQLADITHRWQLEKYFQQVPEWANDVEVRNLFNIRWSELN